MEVVTDRTHLQMHGTLSMGIDRLTELLGELGWMFSQCQAFSRESVVLQVHMSDLRPVNCQVNDPGG